MDNGVYNGKYIGVETMGLKKNSKYTFTLEKPKNECYKLTILNEDILIRYSSKISIKQNWKNLEKED